MSRVNSIMPAMSAVTSLPRCARWLSAGLAIVALAASALAREITIPLTQTEVDGEALGVKPGDVLLLEAGTRPFLKLDRIVGAPEAPVQIRNHGGLVVMRNTDRYYNIFVARSHYFRITGTGDPALPRGIHLDGTGPHGSGVSIAGLSSDYELDHLHISRPGFAGLLLKTDGADGTLLENLLIHDNYIHDSGGEGMYLGETKEKGQTLRHIRIWNNVVVRAGWEACQIAHAESDVEVHHNVFYQAGLGGELWQDNNFQLSSNTTVDFHHNIVIGAGAHLVIAMGGLAKTIRDNYFEGTIAGAGMSLMDSNVSKIANTTLVIERNFFRGVQSVQPIVLFTGERTKLTLRDNVWEGTNRFLRHQPIIDLSRMLDVVNNRQATVAAPRFVDPENGNFHLAADDPYRKLGIGLLPVEKASSAP